MNVSKMTIAPCDCQHDDTIVATARGTMPEHHDGRIRHAIRALTGGEEPGDLQIRRAAWVARCDGRGASAPLLPGDVATLAGTVIPKRFDSGEVLFAAGQAPTGVDRASGPDRTCGRLGSPPRRRRGDAPWPLDGDIALLLEMPMANTARALQDSTCLCLDRAALESLLATRPNIARRWLSSVAQRVSAGQGRLVALLGRTLPAQVAQLLLDESVDGSVQLAQRTLAAMIGVQRRSLNKVLKEFERDRLIAIHHAGIDLIDVDRLQAKAQ
jgi:hypothetical protein